PVPPPVHRTPPSTSVRLLHSSAPPASSKQGIRPAAALESVWSVLRSTSPGWPGPSSNRNSLTITVLMSSLGRRWRGDGALGRCRGLVAQPGAPGAGDVPTCWLAGAWGCVSSLLLPGFSWAAASRRAQPQHRPADLPAGPLERPRRARRAGAAPAPPLVTPTRLSH